MITTVINTTLHAVERNYFVLRRSSSDTRSLEQVAPNNHAEGNLRDTDLHQAYRQTSHGTDTADAAREERSSFCPLGTSRQKGVFSSAESFCREYSLEGHL